MSQPTDDSVAVSPARGEGAAPPLNFAAARSLKRELLEELRAGWNEGKPVRAEDLLPRWPGSPDRDPDVASILFEEFCQRRRQGAAPADEASLEEYQQRFPSQKDSLASLFRQHAVLRSLGGASGGSTAGLALPAVGDELFGFRLRHELGRGAFARVFLAEQEALAGRQVVVKVSAIEGDEPQTLAQLQHTHIVPIYSVHEDPRAGVRAVCMPYFGGASLSRVLQAVWNATDRPARGQELVEALAVVSGPPPRGGKDKERGTEEANGSTRTAGPPALAASSLSKLADLSYTQAAAWIVARLAEGLQHAHDRGVLHCDIKPSNVLLGADGQPMLLDFNLAQKLYGDHSQAQATLGGTVAYMAPEHLRALATRDPALARAVDQRTDLYAMGMVLFEMLTGQRPFDQSASYSPAAALIEAMAVERSRSVPSLRRLRPEVPWGLESIARKCLAPEPAQRYQRAEHLAEDLNRFLEDRPLCYAPELSWAERGRKWVRRHPRLAAAGSVAAVAAALLAGAAGVLGHIQAELNETEVRAEADRRAQERQLRAAQARVEAARDAQARQRQHDFEAGAVRALCLVNTTADVQDHAGQGLEVCEKTLALYGVLGKGDWQTHPDWRRLPPAEQQRLGEDVRELLMLLARARVYTAPDRVFGKERAGLAPTLAAFLAPLGQARLPVQGLAAWAAGERVWRPKTEALGRARTDALREALALLDRGEAIRELPPSAALRLDRAFYREQLGDRDGARQALDRAKSLPPVSARDHYLLATTYAGSGRFAEAVAELTRALEKNPRHYWSWLQRGICYQERGDYALAVGDFTACVVLWPEFAWGYFNRGRVLQQLGKNEEARDDYTAALKQDPGLVYAYVNRGLVHLELGQDGPALADFDAAIARGRDDVVVHGGRGIALEHLGRPREADAAFRRAWARDPNHLPMLLGYAFAVAERLPTRSQAVFRKVLEQEPRNPRALYGMGMLLSNRSAGSPQALYYFSLALEAYPTFVAARRGRALVLAHRGEGEAARQEIDWCVAAEPTGVTLYAAACVYALAAEKATHPREARWTADRAVVLLREALAQGYGRDRAATDSDLNGIRRHPEFGRLVPPGPNRPK